MLFRVVSKILPDKVIEDTCFKMNRKFGTDNYIDMMHEGGNRPLSKYRREFIKSLFTRR